MIDSHKAIICKIDNLRPVVGLDNLLLATVRGYNVLLGKNHHQGEIGIFFDGFELQLSEEFCNIHDLVAKHDENGQKINAGYLQKNRRVRAIKIRGAKSEGLWMPLSCLEYTGYSLSKLKEGDLVDELNGHKLCNKYFNPATLRALQRSKGKTKSPPKKRIVCFPEHEETLQFKKVIQDIPIGSVIYVSEKCHGTSARVAVTPVKINPYNLWMKLKKWATGDRVWWETHNGSRRVILDKNGPPGYYGSNEFRYRVTKNLELHKGEIVYGEIVGFVAPGSPIMSTQDLSPLKDKTLSKKFPSPITYTYGCPDGECEFYVYRIAMTNEDGRIVELSWPQTAFRAEQLGLKTVPPLDKFIYDGDRDALFSRIEKIVEGEEGAVASSIDPRHPQEGVVLRIETPTGQTYWVKHKSFIFGLGEGYLKEKEDFVDLEEIS